MPISPPELEETWRASALAVDDLAVDDDGTITRPHRRRATSTVSDLDTLTGGAGEIALGEPLGEGGMGIVYRARQLSLRRDVAVKALKPMFAREAAGDLIREARVTGALEHPNVVPVHGLGVDADGHPLLVMKRLTGRAWSAVLADRTLDDNLAIFEQLCNAVAFAHQRGVLHRDIKPDNVVLGDFGEVCLVDWGLAVDLGRADIDDLPLAADVAGIDGTLQYMAPEQVVGRGDVLGVHTDIYLLGATLYQLVSGATPHRAVRPGDQVRDLLLEIVTVEPAPLPGDTPDELRAIVTRALAARPEDRYPDALTLRDAVAAYRRHRDSAALADEARARLGAALTEIAGGRTRGPHVGRHLAAARFGFEQALRSWPGNRQAERGLEETLLAAIERELDVERPESARALLDELPATMSRSGHLEQQIAELRRRVDDRRDQIAKLERAARDSDLGQAARHRRAVGIAMGFAMLLAHVGMATGARLGWWTLDHATYLAVTAAIGVAFAIPSLIARNHLFPNRANLRMAYTLGVMLAAQVAVFVGLWQYGLALAPTLAVSLLQLAGSIAIKTALLAPRAQWTAAVALACAGAAIGLPDFAIEFVGVAYATYFFGGGLLSWSDRDTSLLMIDDR